MDDLHKNGKLRQIFYKMGRFDGDQGKDKYIKAPFDLLLWGVHTYIQPTDCGAGGFSANSASGLFGNDEGFELDIARGGNYFVFEPYIMERHDLGDWKGKPDDWRGMFKLGQL
jgi:hypothetical protein